MRKSLCVGVLVALGLVGWAQAQTRSTGEELAQRATVIKPAPQELKWQKIPWVMDLTEGARLAKEERRPIFLWVTGDDPLERC